MSMTLFRLSTLACQANLLGTRSTQRLPVEAIAKSASVATANRSVLSGTTHPPHPSLPNPCPSSCITGKRALSTVSPTPKEYEYTLHRSTPENVKKAEAARKKYAPHVDAYERDGVVTVREVLSDDVMAEVQDHVTYLEKKFPEVPGEHYHHHIMRADPFWVSLVSRQELLDVARAFGHEFITGDVALFSSHYFNKKPKTGLPVLWHQDGAYWSLRPMNVLTLWLSVDKTDLENGGMRVVKGSHTSQLAQLQDTGKTEGEERNVLGAQTHRDEDIDYSRVVDLITEPGDVNILHPNVIHSSPANTSNRRRCGLTVRYISPTTHCYDPDQPVMMLDGAPVPGLNNYRTWPRFQEGYDFEFKGWERWNSSRRVVDEDEHYFDRDPQAIRDEVANKCLEFVDALGGR